MKIMAGTFAESGVSGTVVTTDTLPPPVEEPAIQPDDNSQG
jgi:hypothetical protein